MDEISCSEWLHPNTFRQLFQHSTQPQLEELKNLISDFNGLENVVKSTLSYLGLVMVYLTEMAYVVLLHLVYLILSIYNFNVIRAYYTRSVQLNLILIMDNIRKMLLENSVSLYALMEILILHFCVMINSIFFLIKGKLLFFINRLELQIDVDRFLLSVELASLELLLSELQLDLGKYLSLSKLTNQFLKPLVRLTEDNKKLKELINKVNVTKTIINKLDHKFSYQNVRISKTLKLLSSINLQRSIKSTRDKNPELVLNLKINLEKLKKSFSVIMNMNNDNSLIVKVYDKTQNKMTASIRNIKSLTNNGLQKGVESIQKLLDTADQEVSTEIMSIIGQLLKVEAINLVKLYKLMTQIQLLVMKILARGILLKCTIQFHKEITTETSKLFESLKFESCNAKEFLTQSSKVEKCISTVSDSINNCIKNLAQACNQFKGCLGVRKDLIQLYYTIIVGGLTGLNSQVLKYLSQLILFQSKPLKIDFDHISRFLPSEPFYFEFIVSLKENLKAAISKFDLTTTTDIIDHNLFCIVRGLHEKFESISKQISTKLIEYIKPIEPKIKSIIKETKGSARIITEKIDEINIENLISNFEKNNGSLSIFERYNRKEKLMKRSEQNSQNGSQRGLERDDIDNLSPVYLRLERYKRRMTSHSSIKTKLDDSKTKLTLIKNTIKQICTTINGDSSNLEDCGNINGSTNENNIPDLKQIDKPLVMAVFLKDEYINKLNNHVSYFYSLEQIAEHISSLKGFVSSSLKDKLDSEFCNGVKELKDIDVTQRQFRSYIYNIRLQINYMITELQLTKSLLQYKDSIEIILIWSQKLPSFVKNNVYDFLKISRTIIQTSRDASKTMENTRQEIEKLKEKHSYLTSYVPTNLESDYKSYISQIPNFIKEASFYLKIIRYIIYDLQIIKSNSSKTFNEIKNKIFQIIDLSSSLTKLNEIYSDIIIKYIILRLELC